jgi:hypothetical protein
LLDGTNHRYAVGRVRPVGRFVSDVSITTRREDRGQPLDLSDCGAA